MVEIVYKFGMPSRIDENHLHCYQDLLSKISVNSIDDGDYYGFTIDGNGRFLLGDCTITHNTTELIRLKTRAEIAGKKCLVIKYCHDQRYDQSRLATHSHLRIEAISSNGRYLKETITGIENLDQYDCIYIDEIQFYIDGHMICDQLANQGFEVVVSGLNGTFERKPFGCVSDLIPLVENITFLTAIDPKTGQEAAFTARISGETQEEVVGGSDKYLAADRQHFFDLLNANSD
jgi:thymidine kinase